MSKRNKRIITLAVIGLMAIGISAGCRKNKPEKIRSKVIIIGVDGAGWNFMDPLFKQGKLKNLSGLMKEGSSGILRTINPTKSSVIWTCIATGKSMVKHGIVDWAYIKENKVKVPYTQSQRRAKAFWNIFSDVGLKVGVINWFVTFPPEEVNGYMISPAFATQRHPEGVAITYPADLVKELDFAHEEEYPALLKKENLPDFAKGSPKGSLAAFFRKFLRDDRSVELASLYLFKKHPVDVYATYFRIVDVVSHFGISRLDPKLLEKSAAEAKANNGELSAATRNEVDLAYSHVLEPVYSYMDRIIGRILEMADDKATVIVCSDHTFIIGKDGAGYNHFNMPTIPHGVIFIKGPDFKAGYKIKNAHIYDVLPTILHLLGYPVGEDMDGQVIVEAFKDDFMKSHPVKTIETYEGGAARKIAPGNKEIDKKTLDDLRSLGYIK
jgi:predicted AlkP superfamily phosphohydrolase/phosphomutase